MLLSANYICNQCKLECVRCVSASIYNRFRVNYTDYTAASPVNDTNDGMTCTANRDFDIILFQMTEPVSAIPA